MTMIDVGTSPLQAAREWRGIGVVAAALASGLSSAQAAALENGDAAAFDSIDEMIAAAVVYGASLGIGRDEAIALLDRTVSGSGSDAHAAASGPSPDVVAGVDAASAAAAHESPSNDFSRAVRERSARMAATEVPLPPGFALEPPAPWTEPAQVGELEAWAAEVDDDAAPLDMDAVEPDWLERGDRSGYALLERLVGPERADTIVERVGSWSRQGGDALRSARERLRRSEHATLIVAIGAGAVLIALLVAVGGALGGGEDEQPGPAARPSVEASPEKAVAPATATTRATEAARPAPQRPMVAPARITVNVYNAGSKKGFAKEVAARLDRLGYRIGRVENAKADHGAATILYPASLAREARVLARHTGVTALDVAPGGSREITVVVV